ncbi:uncharacterized protein LOC114078363 [Solanum pennellii]|uniref:Uncharacterized protein LOC114078363 n=1 Tax=Solanum pennellii TaxID=28526 RepID=A0ABM1VGJ1_SOLPN|nr:uncharacterized protein LOC114078363 [Solanum pennellii]
MVSSLLFVVEILVRNFLLIIEIKGGNTAGCCEQQQFPQRAKKIEKGGFGRELTCDLRLPTRVTIFTILARTFRYFSSLSEASWRFVSIWMIYKILKKQQLKVHQIWVNLQPIYS